jgi:hypothetical protein
MLVFSWKELDVLEIFMMLIILVSMRIDEFLMKIF